MYKTFDDLVFEQWPAGAPQEQKYYSMDPYYKDSRQAKMEFPNGWGISVLFGERFYSDGVSTYEAAVLRHGKVCYSTPITDDVLGWKSRAEISRIMEEIQKLPDNDPVEDENNVYL